MAKSSIVASTIPKSHIYHGNRDAYFPSRNIDKSNVQTPYWPAFGYITAEAELYHMSLKE